MTVIDVDGGAELRRPGTYATSIVGVNQSAGRGGGAADPAAQPRRCHCRRFHLYGAPPSIATVILKNFTEALAGDPGQPQVLGWTRLGHIELTRRRRRKPLAEILGERGEHGGWTRSAATIALEALRVAARQAARMPGAPGARRPSRDRCGARRRGLAGTPRAGGQPCPSGRRGGRSCDGSRSLRHPL